jgi:hypothetical protein
VTGTLCVAEGVCEAEGVLEELLEAVGEREVEGETLDEFEAAAAVGEAEAVELVPLPCRPRAPFAPIISRRPEPVVFVVFVPEAVEEGVGVPESVPVSEGVLVIEAVLVFEIVGVAESEAVVVVDAVWLGEAVASHDMVLLGQAGGRVAGRSVKAGRGAGRGARSLPRCGGGGGVRGGRTHGVAVIVCVLVELATGEFEPVCEGVGVELFEAVGVELFDRVGVTESVGDGLGVGVSDDVFCADARGGEVRAVSQGRALARGAARYAPRRKA